MTEFDEAVRKRISANAVDKPLQEAAKQFMTASIASRYSYAFTALGRPIIQYPQDIVAVQELIWRVRPDLVIDIGIAHGGSLVNYASCLAMLDYCDAIEANKALDPTAPQRRVIGVDLDIRAHNRRAIETHPLAGRIDLIEGSSIDAGVISEVHSRAASFSRILVSLDSNHTHDHVLAELIAYAPLTSVGSYCVVFDTIIEYLDKNAFPDRPWGPGNNPKTAIDAYLSQNPQFEIDDSMDNKLLISAAPGGYLRRLR